uniref:Uncharacterized protein n=1 Tax=Rhizophora mucronata TaxID=61149 RepID=A0A2P2QVY2_RHIMU
MSRKINDRFLLKSLHATCKLQGCILLNCFQSDIKIAKKRGHLKLRR